MCQHHPEAMPNAVHKFTSALGGGGNTLAPLLGEDRCAMGSTDAT